MAKLKFTTSSTEEVFSRLNSFKYFNETFKNYNILFEGVEVILIVFKAFPDDDALHPPKSLKRMRRKTKTLKLYLVLDYERIMSGTHDDNLAYMKEVFIKGCETFLEPMKGFDYTKFYTDVKKFLKAN